MEALIKTFVFRLKELKTEINSFQEEADIWKTVDGIKNDSGHLTLHLIGNLNHFIGHGLGKTNYVRDRDNEFSSEAVPLDTLNTELDVTIEMVSTVLYQIRNEVNEDFPIPLWFKEQPSTQFFLYHLLAHLTYHTGQINYLRRFLERESE